MDGYITLSLRQDISCEGGGFLSEVVREGGRQMETAVLQPEGQELPWYDFLLVFVKRGLSPPCEAGREACGRKSSHVSEDQWVDDSGEPLSAVAQELPAPPWGAGWRSLKPGQRKAPLRGSHGRHEAAERAPCSKCAPWKKTLKRDIFLWPTHGGVYNVLAQVISTQTRFQEIVLVTSNEEYLMSWRAWFSMDDLPGTIAQAEPGKEFTNGNLRSSGLLSRELSSVPPAWDPVPSLQPRSSHHCHKIHTY